MAFEPHGTIRGRRVSHKELYDHVNRLIKEYLYEAFGQYIGSNWFDHAQLAVLIQVASYDVHGGVTLYIDGDCFIPPECKCTLTGWSFGRHRGAGGTLNEAVLRAIRIREIRNAKQRSIPHKEATDDSVQIPGVRLDY